MLTVPIWVAVLFVAATFAAAVAFARWITVPAEVATLRYMRALDAKEHDRERTAFQMELAGLRVQLPAGEPAGYAGRRAG
jgi:hypothetical protein